MASTAWSLLMLLLVLAAIPLVLWTLKRVQTFRPPGSQRTLEVTAQLALGARERIVMVRVEGRVLVLGVTPQQISLLTEANAAALPPTAAPGMPPSFSSLLRGAAGLPPGRQP